MVNRHKPPEFLKRFMINRKGTAEVVGSVLFIVIILFFFSNIYLWHDSQTKTMNNLLSDKLNSQIQVNWLLNDAGQETNTLVVTNTGGVETILSRLWIVTSRDISAKHLYADLESANLHIAAGTSIKIALSGGSIPSGSEIIPVTLSGGVGQIPYTRTKADGETFTILTTLGNMASPQGTLKIVNQTGGNGNSNAPVGSVIVANFSTFNYYLVSGSSIGAPNNGYNINSNAANVAFSVVLTNMDENHRNITLNSNCQMFFINTKNPNNVGYLIFYTANVDNNGNISPTYSNVNLVYDKPTVVYFGSANPIAGSSHFTAKNLVTSGNKPDPGVYPLNLALLGTFSDGSSLGQNIPFVSIYINN